MPNQKPKNGTAKKEINELHPAWIKFIRYCEAIRFGELQNLKIHNGLPVSAEKSTEKVKFND